MRHLPLTLTAPTLLLAAASLNAADENWTITPKVYTQFRAEMNSGSNASGDDTVPSTETAAENSDLLDFYLRRARLGASFKKDAWSGQITFNADGSQRDGSQTRSASLFDAWGAYTTKSEDITHQVKAGLYRVRFNPSEGNGSNNLMLAGAAATENLVNQRDMGVGYYFKSAMVDFNIDIGNVTADGTDGQTENQQNPDDKAGGDGLWKSFRLQFNGHEDWKTTEWLDSYAGKPGQNYAVAIEAAHVDQRITGADQTITSFGFDALFHHHEISALFEYRVQTTETEPDGGSSTDVNRMVWRAQFGYAFPVEGLTGTLEPCIRVQGINLERGAGGGVFGGRDYAQNSGMQYDLGLNWYLDGHKNKLGLMITSWSSGDEDNEADALIIRLQHQFNF